MVYLICRIAPTIIHGVPTAGDADLETYSNNPVGCPERSGIMSGESANDRTRKAPTPMLFLRPQTRGYYETPHNTHGA